MKICNFLRHDSNNGCGLCVDDNSTWFIPELNTYLCTKCKEKIIKNVDSRKCDH